MRDTSGQTAGAPLEMHATAMHAWGRDAQYLMCRSLTQGGNQVLKYDYQTLVSSFKDEPVQVQVWDRLLHGETETIGAQASFSSRS